MPTPILIQHVNGPNTRGDTATVNPGTYNMPLPNPSQSGDCLIVGFTGPTNYAGHWHVGDDSGSNTWNSIVIVDDTTNTQTLQIWLALNVVAGVKVVTVSTDSTGGTRPIPSFFGACVSEFANVATASAVDTSGGTFNPTTGTAVAPGTITTTVDGDLIWQYAFNSGTGSVTSWTAQSGYTMLHADRVNGSAVQFTVQGTHGGINPTLTQSPSSGWETAAIALKPAAAGGTVPSGIYVKRVSHLNTTNETAGTVTLQFPCEGNLIACLFTSGVSYQISSISDGTNTYNLSSAITTATTVAMVFWASVAAPGNTITLTITMSGSNPTGHGATFMMFDIQGADPTSPLDTGFGTSGIASNTGNQPTGGGGGNVTLLTATPSGTDQLTLMTASIDQDTCTGVPGPSGATFIPTTYTDQPQPSLCDENNFYAIYYNAANTAAQTWILAHNTQNTPGIGNWSAVGFSFKAPAAPGGGTAFGDDSFGMMPVSGFDQSVTIF